MSKEQWIIYIYGIYPEGGISAMFVITTFILLLIMSGSYFSYKDDLSYGYKKTQIIEEYKEKTLLFQTLSGPTKIVGTFTLVVIVLGNFIPSKNSFLALVAMPSISKSYTESDGKLHKIDSIIEKVLIRTDKILTEEIKEEK